MALQTKIIKKAFGQDNVFNDAYFKVVRIIEFSKVEGCKFDVEVYKDKESSTNPSNLIEGLGIVKPYDPDCEAPILKECYNFLKTLPEFKDSKDC